MAPSGQDSRWSRHRDAEHNLGRLSGALLVILILLAYVSLSADAAALALIVSARMGAALRTGLPPPMTVAIAFNAGLHKGFFRSVISTLR